VSHLSQIKSLIAFDNLPLLLIGTQIIQKQNKNFALLLARWL